MRSTICLMSNSDQSANESIQGQPDSNVDNMTVSPTRARVRARWAEISFLLALGVYALLALLANRYAYFGWDLELARRIQSISAPGFGVVMTAVSLLGNWYFAWPAVIVTGVALISKGLRIEGVLCMAGPASGSLVNRLLKLAIGRPRPTDALVHVTRAYHHESFPSGHVVFFIEFFGFLFFLSYVLLKPGRLRRGGLVVLGLLIVLVGVSRVYLGAHWPSDVLGAYLAGGVWLMLMIEIYRRLKARETK
jgi:membrane-associated phospholipid phosphatase